MRPRRGFTIIELMLVLVLLTAFAAVAGWTTLATLRLMHDAPAHSNRQTGLHHFAETLSTDIFSSTPVITSPTTLQCRTTAGDITWTIAPDGTASRLDPDGSIRTFRSVAPAGVFTADGPHVRLTSRFGVLSATSELARISAGRSK